MPDASRNMLHILSKRMRLSDQLFIDSIKRQITYERHANVDQLTGLHNRRWMNEMFERQMHLCALNHELPSVTISLGLSEISAEDKLEQLVARADAALYRAKHAGRNCFSH